MRLQPILQLRTIELPPLLGVLGADVCADADALLAGVGPSRPVASRAVASRLVVAVAAGGVVNVSTPHLTSLPVKVEVQTVSVGPVTVPSRIPVP